MTSSKAVPQTQERKEQTCVLAEIDLARHSWKNELVAGIQARITLFNSLRQCGLAGITTAQRLSAVLQHNSQQLLTPVHCNVQYI